MQRFWNPADTGEPKQANPHLIWLALCASKCVKKDLILLRECGKHFQISRTPWTQWQMGRVQAWRGRGHFITGCCSKPCGRQSKPICHQKNKAHTGITRPRHRESLCLRFTPVRTPALPRSITKNLLQKKQAHKQETKLSKRQPSLFFFFSSGWIKSTSRKSWFRITFLKCCFAFSFCFYRKILIFPHCRKLSSCK